MDTKLKSLRTAQRLTQQQLADYLHIEPATYGRYERGDRQPPLEIIILLAKLYHVSTDYIFGLVESNGTVLTLDETRLISAYRNADPRAQADSLYILLRHNVGE